MQQNHTEGIRVLPNMKKERYTHMSIYYHGSIYVFGGRYFGEDEQGILEHCERLKLDDDSWEVIAPMQSKRCTGFCCIYRDMIYVFGGYTGHLNRSRDIERYHDESNRWEILDIKLLDGIECGIMISE